jgi:carbon storage regulator
MLSEASQTPAAPALRPSKAPRASAEGRGLPLSDSDDPGTRRLGGLVLTRHLDESIMIGDEVELQVVGIKSGTVRLKIVAPRSIPVHRREVFDAIRSSPAPQEVAPPAEPNIVRPGKPQGGLVLTRSAQQSIMIGGEVEIAVVEIRPSTVKLRISAPKSVAVHRREVFEAIRDGRP